MKKVWICLFGASLVGAASALDAWDPGDNTYSNATELVVAASERTNGLHTLDYTESDNADWFRIDLVAGQRYRFESTGTADIDASLYRGNDAEIFVLFNQDNGESANFELVYVPESNGTYYLSLQYYANSEGLDYASYNLLYQFGPVLDAWDPSDNTYSNAPSLIPEESENIHGPHYLGAADTSDWFHFYLETNLTYTLEAIGGWDTIGTLYRGNGMDEVAYNDDSGVDGDEELNFSLTYTPDVAGDYYLKVVNYDEGDNLEFSLRYWISDQPDSDSDGMSDADEAIAGTDPTNSASFFAITNWSADSFTIEWPAFSNRQYQVYKADSLTNGFIPVGGIIYYPSNSYTDDATGNDGFYKVEVQLQ